MRRHYILKYEFRCLLHNKGLSGALTVEEMTNRNLCFDFNVPVLKNSGNTGKYGAGCPGAIATFLMNLGSRQISTHVYSGQP